MEKLIENTAKYLQFDAENLRLNVLERSAVDLDESFALFAEGNSGGGLLQ